MSCARLCRRSMDTLQRHNDGSWRGDDANHEVAEAKLDDRDGMVERDDDATRGVALREAKRVGEALRAFQPPGHGRPAVRRVIEYQRAVSRPSSCGSRASSTAPVRFSQLPAGAL